MFKPRLRLPRRTGLVTPARSVVVPGSASSISPFSLAAQRATYSSEVATGNAHTVPLLAHNEAFSKDGVPGLYSNGGFNQAWTQYQTWCIDELNRLIEGTQFEGYSTLDLANITSREPELASIFNHASMAFNNHFFFETLSATGGQDPAEHMPLTLKEDLDQSFGSLETLQRELIITANAMFGPGFVWLVRLRDQSGGPQRFPYRILATYLAGSPFPAAHWRRQGTDMNSQGGITDRAGETVRHYFDLQARSNKRTPMHGTSTGGFASTPSSHTIGPDGTPLSGSSSTSALSSETYKAPGGADFVPLLCVNTWQHAFLYDYGVHDKLRYLASWWRIINWGKVAERAALVGDKKMSANPQVSQPAAATAV